MAKNHILIIDDKLDHSKKMSEMLKKEYNLKAGEIDVWDPKSGHNDPFKAIEAKLDEGPTLVICDFDLTEKSGIRGLFGPLISKMCHSRLIPVGEYTRKDIFKIPTTTNLFNISIDRDNCTAAAEIVAVYRGFKTINKLVADDAQSISQDLSYSNVLARILGREYLYYEFSKYMDSFERVNEFLIQYLENKENFGNDLELAKNRVISYVIGHVLLNTVLRYPGPILSEQILCSYLSISKKEKVWLKNNFQKAIYHGPFSEMGTYYWLEIVDNIIDKNSKDIGNVSYVGAFNQAVVKNMKKDIKLHKCKRSKTECQKGGYYCPFTKQTVCEHENCSVISTGWIPIGANICRVEREYFDTWQPILTR